MTSIFLVRGPRPECELPARKARIDFIDNSFTRPPVIGDRTLLGKAWEVMRDQGTGALARRVVQFSKRRLQRSQSWLIDRQANQ
jgi:hypothetical protein